MRFAPVALAMLSCRGSAPSPSPSPSPAPAPAPTRAPAAEPAPAPDAAATAAKETIATDWCVAGLDALDEETCYVLPTLASDKPARLLVYLHGIVPPVPDSPQKENVMASVRNASLRAGAAAIVPRGVRGIGPRASKDWWAWPTTRAKHAELASSLVARIVQAKSRLEALAGRAFDRTYLAGSSNGAYFATALALGGEIDVDALGAMSGGAPAPIVRRKPLAVYVGFGRHDPSTQRGARALARTAKQAGFPVSIAEHPFGHGAREVYLDEAFAFWDDAVLP